MNAPAFEHTPDSPVAFHEFANIFPMMSGQALDELRDDIRQHGVRDPIVFLGNAILDGRNRYMCARDLGMDYPRVEFDGDDPLAFVISHNLHRRHLNESQRGMVAAKLAKMPRGGDRTGHHSANLHSASDTAELLNVSERTVKSAKKVSQKGVPELVNAVERGDLSVSLAAKAADLAAEEQTEAVRQPDRASLRRSVLAAVDDAKRGESRKNPNRTVCPVADRVSKFSGLCRSLADFSDDVERIAEWKEIPQMAERLPDHVRVALGILNRFMEAMDA